MTFRSVRNQVHMTTVAEAPLYQASGLPYGSEVDIVMSGGGLRGYYMCGAAVVLKALVKSHGLKVCRISGASAGAWNSLFIACDLHPLDWAESYYESMRRADEVSARAQGRDTARNHLPPFISVSRFKSQALLDGYRSFHNTMLMKLLPSDAYIKCSGKVFISITTVTVRGLKNKIVSEFTSNEDLIAACMASSTIPFVSTKHLVTRFRGEVVLDGGCTNNLPVFTDAPPGRRQVQ
jgi:predicted acylesterase/phospholipase RssA